MIKTKHHLLILIGGLLLISLVTTLILLVSKNNNKRVIKPNLDSEQNLPIDTNNSSPQPPKTKVVENQSVDLKNDSQTILTATANQPVAVGELPANWQKLSAIEKVALNPIKCDIRVEILYASDGSCHYYRASPSRSHDSIGNRVILEGYLRDSRFSKQTRLNALDHYCQLPQAKDCVTWTLVGGQAMADDPLAQKQYPSSPALRSYRKFVNEAEFKTRYQVALESQLAKYGNCQTDNSQYKQAIKNLVFKDQNGCQTMTQLQALNNLLMMADPPAAMPQWLLNLRFKHRLANLTTTNNQIQLVFLVHPSEHKADKPNISFQDSQALLDYLHKPNLSKQQKINALEDYCNFPKTPRDCMSWAIAGGAGDEETSDDPLGKKTYQDNPALEAYRKFVAESAFQTRYKQAVVDQLKQYGNCQVDSPAYIQAQKRLFFQDRSGCTKKANFLALNNVLAFSDSDQQTPAWLLELRLQHKLAGIYSVQADTFFVFLTIDL